jgi:hypothetical protein
MAETRVDLLHLLEDLRDAYPGSLEETILTELVANALDSGARNVALHADLASRSLTVVDDGSGMKRRDLVRYHDIAGSTKTRGEGIGFAGVGVKLGLLAAEEVVTETRRGKVHAATAWHLASRHRAPWRRVHPPGLVGARGTAVRLLLHNPLSPLLDPGFIEEALQQTFPTILDATFAQVLAEHYPEGVAFAVNGRPVAGRAVEGERTAIAIRMGRRRRPSAVGFLVRSPTPVPEGRRGLGISTLGKLIRAGWGTNNVDHCTRLCHASSVAALMEGINSGAVSNQVRDVANAEVIFVIGANPTMNHPVAATWMKNAVKSGAKLIVALTESAAAAPSVNE